MITDIRHGPRPSRPTDPSQNQWLLVPVWNAITACWSDKLEQRYELAVVHRIFSESGQRKAQNVEQGDLNTQQQKPHDN